MIFLSNFLTLISINLFLKRYFPFRFSKKRFLFILTFLTWFLISFKNHQALPIETKLLLYLILTIYVFLIYKHSPFRIFCIWSICYFTVALSEELAVFLWARTGLLLQPIHTHSWIYFIIIVLTQFLFHVQSRLIYGLIDLIRQISLPFFFSIFLIPSIILTAFGITYGNLNIDFENVKACLLFCVLMFFEGLSLLFPLLEMRTLFVRSYLQAQTKMVRFLDDQYQNTFNFIHDLLTNLSSLDLLFNNRKWKELDQNLKELTQITFRQFNQIYTRSPVFDILLKEREVFIHQHQIEIDIFYHQDLLSYFSLSKQIHFFESLLDISLKAACTYPGKRKIWLHSKGSFHFHLRIRCSSSMNAHLQKEISAFLQNYPFDVYFQYETQWEVSCISFVLQCH